MNRYVLWILAAVIFCALTYGGCGGDQDSNFIENSRGYPLL